MIANPTILRGDAAWLIFSQGERLFSIGKYQGVALRTDPTLSNTRDIGVYDSISGQLVLIKAGDLINAAAAAGVSVSDGA